MHEGFKNGAHFLQSVPGQHVYDVTINYLSGHMMADTDVVTGDVPGVMAYNIALQQDGFVVIQVVISVC